MKKLVAYITSAFPNKDFTVDLALSLKESGVDMLELGIPFSDPVADGAKIEMANHLALKKGFKFSDTLEITSKISDSIDTFWMGYFNSFYQKGIENITKKAKELNLKGFIIPDLPFEETKEYRNTFDRYDIANITFVAPTDSNERIQLLVRDAKEFIYMVAYAGITGSQKQEDIKPFIDSIKRYTDTPVYVGFGVNKDTAKQKAKNSDGVIVGSAFIDILLKDELSNTQKIKECSELARVIKSEINS